MFHKHILIFVAAQDAIRMQNDSAGSNDHNSSGESVKSSQSSGTQVSDVCYDK